MLAEITTQIPLGIVNAYRETIGHKNLKNLGD